MNVHRGTLLLVPQRQCISSFVFYITIAKTLNMNFDSGFIILESMVVEQWREFDIKRDL